MSMISFAAALLATLAIVPDVGGIVAAKSYSKILTSTQHNDELKDAASSSSLLSSLISLFLARIQKQRRQQQQQQQNGATVAAGVGSVPHHRQLQLEDETTGERLQSAPPTSGSMTATCTTCSFPLVYTFRLALNNSCSTSTLSATESYLLSGTECQMSASEMLPPSYISSIHFLEFDNTAYLNVIHENTTYLNNVTFYNDDTFTFPSSIADSTNPTSTLMGGDDDEEGKYPLPGGAGLFMFGNDDDGKPILRNQIVWTFGTPGLGDSGDCTIATMEMEGKSLGWVVIVSCV